VKARPRLVAHLLVTLGFASLPLACKVDEAAFQARVFGCDTASAHPLCGTDQSGAPMTCFAARQLGGTDFCTQACDEPMSLPDENAQCVDGNAKLKSCSPMAGDDSCGRPELGCLRTDVTTDEGVCVTMKPCSQDSDCHDPVRSTCASTFFSQLYSQTKDKGVNTDHLYCLQEGCDEGSSACSPGEVCLKKVIPAAAHPPDICVPKCDSNNLCPPNFICLKNDKISGPGNPAVCVPGLLGFKCQTDIDCLVGKCVFDGGDQVIPMSTGLHLCTVDCASDADCAIFDSDQGLFYCSAEHHCVTPAAYTGGSVCTQQADCTRDPLTTDCFRLSASSTDMTCVHPCADDGSCPVLGGVPHTCVPGATRANGKPGACLPGLFGLPCASDANCLPGLSCRSVSATTKICTELCQNDNDCAASKFGGGFCGGQVCLPNNSLPNGTPCARDNQCSSGKCAPPADMSSPTPTCQKTTSS
jgi:hypothetical protein